MRLIILARSLFVVLMAVGHSSGQDVPPVKSGKQFPPADCEAVDSAAACHSFNEMLKSGDRDILTFFAGPDRDAYVCFDQKEDDFVTITFRLPTKWAAHDEKFRTLTDNGLLFFHEYRNGLLDAAKSATLKWQKYDWEDANWLGTSDGKADPDSGTADAAVSDTEVYVLYPFVNAAKTTTNYSITIRRATKRYEKVLDLGTKGFPEGVPHTLSTTGRCAEYSDP